MHEIFTRIKSVLFYSLYSRKKVARKCSLLLEESLESKVAGRLSGNIFVSNTVKYMCASMRDNPWEWTGTRGILKHKNGIEMRLVSDQDGIVLQSMMQLRATIQHPSPMLLNDKESDALVQAYHRLVQLKTMEGIRADKLIIGDIT